MRMFLDCRNRLNEPQFLIEIDPDDDGLAVAIMRAEHAGHNVISLPSRDRTSMALFRVLDVDRGEGGVLVKLIRAIPLH